MAKEKTLETLFHDTLKDIYFAEKKILNAIPKMKRAAKAGDLQDAFNKHHKQTEKQIDRLEQVFAMLGKKPQGKTCEAIKGLLSEGDEIISEFKGNPALDAALISAAQAVEHYEMARYGTLKQWAKQLDMMDAAKLLDASLQEEADTDQSLSELAENTINEASKAA